MAVVERIWFMGAGQQDLSFDCVMRESHQARLTVTHNPVETGVSIADHAYMEPLQITIEAIVSDWWLHGRDQSGNFVADIWGTQQGPNALALPGSTGQSNRSATAWLVLNNLLTSAEPFDVQTGLKLYSNMVLTSLDADQDKSSAGKLAFRATLEEVIQVSTQTVTYPPRAPKKTTHQASQPVAGGEKPPEPVTQQQADTMLFQMTGQSSQAPHDFVTAPPSGF